MPTRRPTSRSLKLKVPAPESWKAICIRSRTMAWYALTTGVLHLDAHGVGMCKVNVPDGGTGGGILDQRSSDGVTAIVPGVGQVMRLRSSRQVAIVVGTSHVGRPHRVAIPSMVRGKPARHPHTGRRAVATMVYVPAGCVRAIRALSNPTHHRRHPRPAPSRRGRYCLAAGTGTRPYHYTVKE